MMPTASISFILRMAASPAAIETAPHQKEPVTKMRPAAARNLSLPVTAPSA